MATPDSPVPSVTDAFKHVDTALSQAQTQVPSDTAAKLKEVQARIDQHHQEVLKHLQQHFPAA